MKPEPMRIGLIGAGRRIKGNYLPALFSLKDHYRVVWAHARRPEPLREAIAPWGVVPMDTLDAEALAQVEAVALSVPIEQNANVLRQLQSAKDRLHLFIDTPMVKSLKQARELVPLLRGFRSVTVTEDFMNFPEWSFVRDVVVEGVIGEVTNVVLDGSGYYYHGLAFIRSLFDFAPVRTTRYQPLGGEHSVNTFTFADGRRGHIVYPYRRFEGTATIFGTRRTISTWPAADTSRPVIELKRHHDDCSYIRSIQLVGDGFDRTLDLPDVPGILAMPDHDRTDLNLMRTLGLRAVFRSVFDPDINARYGLMAGIYDSIVSRRANRRKFDFDPLAIAGRGTLVAALLR